MQAPTLPTRPGPKAPVIFPPLSREDQDALAAVLSFVRQAVSAEALGRNDELDPTTAGDPAMAQLQVADGIAALEQLLIALPYLRSLLPAERQQALDQEDTAFARVAELEPEATELARQFAQMPKGPARNDLLQRLNQLTNELALRLEDYEALRGERRNHAPRAAVHQ
jgi:hypothetical protein